MVCILETLVANIFPIAQYVISKQMDRKYIFHSPSGKEKLVVGYTT